MNAKPQDFKLLCCS